MAKALAHIFILIGTLAMLGWYASGQVGTVAHGSFQESGTLHAHGQVAHADHVFVPAPRIGRCAKAKPPRIFLLLDEHFSTSYFTSIWKPPKLVA